MIVKDAKAVARQWVNEIGRKTAGFCGAFFHGSTNWLPDDAVLPATSDLDVMVVLADPNLPNKPGKFMYRDVMLEVSYLPQEQLQSPTLILGQSHMAGSFHKASVIADPTGQLTKLQAAISKDYAKRQWVRKRCDHARDKVLNNLKGLDPAAPFHDQVLPWLFGTGVTTHILLVAGLKNPTVRKRYLAAHDLLVEYGHLDFYPSLLELLGCAQMSRAQVEQHLAVLTTAFDAAKAVIKTPFSFAADISDLARPVAIDGSRELIERGYHREAIFWMVATYSRCQQIFACDASRETQEQFNPGYRQLLGDLEITSFADLQQRSDQVKAWLPRIWEVAAAIMAANPEIEDE
ncbi:MAG: hypothetical protein H0X37_11625 [Herpetosiphonaceae bacterium]|nr:hypothetical protein [Herpetosiphonaceae bacterium]